MRQRVDGEVLAVRAIGGLHVVTLAWDFQPGPDSAARREGLLGFAVERWERRDGHDRGRGFLKGIKRFREVDAGLAPGTPVPTSRHPVQSFQWGDYTARPGRRYVYRVIPVYGQPARPELDEAAATTVEIGTEPEQAPAGPDTRHDVYFNRGVAGSQAYARKFPGMRPDPARPDSAQMVWLSRGLFEALTGFIGRAAGPDAADHALRAMLYEFRFPPVAEAFRRAHEAGADLDLRYEAQTYREENEATIAAAGLAAVCTPQKSRAGIRHNKFIVLLRRGEPLAVWTGSTNLSAGGIFGHSNVGHIVWDAGVARRYLELWQRLAAPDVTRAPLLRANRAAGATPGPAERPPTGPSLTLFSPRDDPDTLQTLRWYAGLMASARSLACMTFAFNLDDLFRDVLLAPGETLRYALFDKPLSPALDDQINGVGNAVIASGARLAAGDLETFIGEELTGFNRNEYIHDKFLLVDPLGDDPVVVTGSANFSRPSQTANDENMLVIRGDRRVADIYFGEFMRLFDHLYARYLSRRLRAAGAHDPGAGFLKDTAAGWVPQHFQPGRKARRRVVFLGA